MTDSSLATDAAAHSLTHEVKLLIELMRLCRVMLLYGDPGAQRDHLLHSEIVPLLQAVRPGGERELVILFDAWGGTPMAALRARIHAALAQISTEPIPDRESGQPLADVLRSGQEACNATFLIIFDRFNEYLIAPSDDGMREFEDEFVQAANDAALRANFLLVLDQNAEPLLERLRDRIPFHGNDSVRLPPPKLPAGQPVAFSQMDAVSTAGSEVEQTEGDAPPIGAAASEALIQTAEFVSKASLHSRKGRPMLTLAIVVLICSVAGAGVWYAQRTTQPVASLTEQRATPSGRVQENASEHPTPQKAPAAGDPPRERIKLSDPEHPPPLPKAAKKQSASAAAKIKAQTKPKAALPKPRVAAARPNNANAGPIKENPKPAPPRVAPAPSVQPPPKLAVQPPPKLVVPPAEPTRAATTVAAVQPQRTIDQVYEQRAGQECERGLVGALCREKIRYQLCAGKWTRDEQPGITRCYVW